MRNSTVVIGQLGIVYGSPPEDNLSWRSDSATRIPLSVSSTTKMGGPDMLDKEQAEAQQALDEYLKGLKIS